MKLGFGNHNRDCVVGKDLDCCGVLGGHLLCTLRKGHRGNHQACTGHNVVLVWPRWLDKKKRKTSEGSK